MLALDSKQIYKLADILLHNTYPDAETVVSLPLYIQMEWKAEADKAVEGYNIVKKLLDKGIIQNES